MPIWSFCGLDDVLVLSVQTWWWKDLGFVRRGQSGLVRCWCSRNILCSAAGNKAQLRVSGLHVGGGFSFSVKKYTFYLEGIWPQIRRKMWMMLSTANCNFFIKKKHLAMKSWLLLAVSAKSRTPGKFLFSLTASSLRRFGGRERYS